MIFGFGQQAALLDDQSVCWMLDVFEWAGNTFDAKAAAIQSKLIYPTNEFFPGRGGSLENMAALIFSQVISYVGMAGVPCELQNENGYHHAAPTMPNSEGLSVTLENEKLVFSYHTQTLNDPEVLIASFVHQIAFYLVANAPEPPPGGKENWPHIAEILAIILGFGVIMANSANTKKIRSCGSCSGPAVERESFLSQYDMSYALAIFCTLNNISVKEATLHLKATLRTFYKKAYKEINSSKFIFNEELSSLQAMYSNNEHRINQSTQ